MHGRYVRPPVERSEESFPYGSNDPKGARVYVTGRDVGTNGGADFATIAYQV